MFVNHVDGFSQRPAHGQLLLRRRRVLRSEPADGMSREERTSGEKLRSARKIAFVNNFLTPWMTFKWIWCTIHFVLRMKCCFVCVFSDSGSRGWTAHMETCAFDPNHIWSISGLRLGPSCSKCGLCELLGSKLGYPFFPQNWWIVEFNSPLCGVLATHQLHEVVRKGNHLKVGLEANHANFHELSVAKSLVYHAAATWRGRAAVCERTQVATQLSCGDTVTKFVANNVGPTCIFVLPHRRARLFWLRRLSFSVLLGRPTRRSIILQFLDRRTYMYQTDIQWYNDWCRHWHIRIYMYTMHTHEYEDPRSELLVIYPLLMVWKFQV